MHIDIHVYDTGSGENMDVYAPRVIKDNYKRSWSTWLAIYAIRYLLMLKNIQLLILLYKIIRNLEVGWNNVAGPTSIDNWCAVGSYMHSYVS